MSVRCTNMLANRVNDVLFNERQLFDQIKFSPYGAPSLAQVMRVVIFLTIDYDNSGDLFAIFDQSVGGLYRGSTSSARHEAFQMIFDIADALLVVQ